MFDHVKDSGERELFDTGSVRDSEAGKGRYDLLPFYALQRLAQHYQNGADKYGPHNWRKGQRLGRYLSSAIRHLANYAMGDRSEDHLSAAVFNIFSIIETERMIQQGRLIPELDDLKGIYD